MARLQDKQFDKNKWAEMLKIKQAEDKAVKEALRANKAAGLLSKEIPPGEGGSPYQPYKPKPSGPYTPAPPREQPTKIAGAQDIHTKTNPLQDGSFLDEDGNRYIWSPRGGKFIDMGPYDPDFHGLPLPLAKNRSGMMVAHGSHEPTFTIDGIPRYRTPGSHNPDDHNPPVDPAGNPIEELTPDPDSIPLVDLLIRGDQKMANAADIPLGDGLIRQTMNQVQQANKQKYDLMYQEGFINRQQYIKQMKRTFGKNYEQFLIEE